MSGRRGAGGDPVATALAVALGLVIVLITIGVLYDAITDPNQTGLGENSTQVLETAFGGILGILGAYLGFQRGAASRQPGDEPADDDDASEPVDDQDEHDDLGLDVGPDIEDEDGEDVEDVETVGGTHRGEPE
jgi:hypothetical protein